MNILLSNNEVQYSIEYKADGVEAFPSLKKLSKKKKYNTTCDVVYKLNGLYSLLKDESINSYLEPMAGIGFSAGLIEAMFNPDMILNDISETCWEHLKERFPNQMVYNEDCKKNQFLRRLPIVDCCFLDPNHNLFRRNKDILLLYLYQASSIFICGDSLPFSWSLPWDEMAFRDYLKSINKTVFSAGWSIKEIYLYPHKRVMIIKFKKHKSKIKIITCKKPFALRILKRPGLL